MTMFAQKTAAKFLPHWRRGGGVLLILLLLLTFVVRVHNLEVQSLWNDEGNSYVQATRALPDIIANAARDIHPPGYYALLGGWRLLAGESEFALRFPSTLALVLAAAFLYAIGRRLFGAGASLLAVGFTALNTFSIYYAQEARMYALLTLCVAALFWSILRLLERPTWRRAAVLGVVTAAGLYTQYAFPFFMLAGGLAVVGFAVFRRGAGNEPAPTRLLWRPLLAFAAANILALVLYLPWLPEAMRQITTWPNTGEATPPGEAFAVIIRWLTFGITGEGATMAIPFILLVFGLIRLRRNDLTPRPRTQRSCCLHAASLQERGNTPLQSGSGFVAAGARDLVWPILVPVLWVAVPLLIFLVMGLFRPANLKFLLPAQLGMALWLARGVVVLWRGARGGLLRLRSPEVIPQVGVFLRLAGAGAAAWLVFTQLQLLPPLYSDARYQRADYRAIAARIRDELGAGDAVILNAPNQAEVFGYYYGRLPEDTASVYGVPAGLGGDDRATRDQLSRIVFDHENGYAYALFWGERERDPHGVVEEVLFTRAFPFDSYWYGDVRFARYAMPNSCAGILVQLATEFITLNGNRIPVQVASILADLPSCDLQQVSPGETLRVSLAAGLEMTTNYTTFVQLLNSESVLVSQRDNPPSLLFPDRPWYGGEYALQHFGLFLPDTLLPGEYTLIAGVYPSGNPAARLRLPDGRDYLELARITVAPANP